jgi:hypothetical protein
VVPGLSLDPQGKLAEAAGGTFSGFERLSVTGTAFNDIAPRQRLGGGANGDDLNGDAGDDTLEGRDDSDLLVGGFGSRHPPGGAGGRLLRGGLGNNNNFIFGVSVARASTMANATCSRARTATTRSPWAWATKRYGGAGTDALQVTLARRASGVQLDLRTDAFGALAGALGGTLAGFEAVTDIRLTDFNDVLIRGTAVTRATSTAWAATIGSRATTGPIPWAATRATTFWKGGAATTACSAGDGRDPCWAATETTRSTPTSTTPRCAVSSLYENARRADTAAPANDTLNGGGGDDQLIGGWGTDN